MNEIDNIKRAVLIKLFNRKVIGSHHIRLVTLRKCGWKAHEQGFVKKAVKQLINESLLVWANKSKKALTLNKGRMKDIVQRMKG